MRLPGRWWLIAAGLVALLVLLRVAVFRPRPVEVEVVTVARGVVEDAVTNSQAGTVKARLRARVGADRAGRVAAIPHREGSSVRRGESLLLLDASTATTQLDAARRDLEAAHAAADAAAADQTLAKQQFDRTQSLFASRMVSQGDMDQAKSRFESADAVKKGGDARARRAEAAVRLAGDELAHLEVRAPFDGVISERLVEVGESVIPGQPVMEVVSLDPLYVSAPLDEIDIGRVREGLPARVTLDPYRGRVWQATVSRVAPVVNDVREQNRTLEVEVELKKDPSAPTPKPGTSADVEIILDRRPDVLRVPTNAVIEGKRVLVLDKGAAASRDVKIGLKNWDWTEVVSGVREGETVITSLEKQGVKAGARAVAKAAAGKP
ncbi:MAG: efflux RND transporter periplasmic adaptor subunit [Candidatus Eisenbacteria bacterium]|uniref:Efflux RND transporter periplasmic adaptor subunit n=1 Tax=Eiseniibacteriota bacterium TaxID=2212470 RepID=A0A9D6QIG7_UNCEI|nr:efflux RND transporter periplasmic adaptor subunit [Candidatus Eisenbacteria bacterium]MBI3539332.1 efflux RND transporter periplasmic adaptor subunit [Candidatus Eisenbacteria bacterium]